MLACMKEVTQILSALEQGKPHAAEQLLPLVYAGVQFVDGVKASTRVTQQEVAA